MIDPQDRLFELPPLEVALPEEVMSTEDVTTPNLKSRNAFGRVPKPEYFGIDTTVFGDVTPEERAAIAPDHAILRRLYGSRSGRSVDTLALNSAEYEAIVRSPGAFAVSVAAKTDQARQIDNNVSRRADAVDRSVDHAFDSKVSRADKVISGLDSEHAALAKLLRNMGSPGYAHMSEADMRILAETARRSFDNILEVVGHQANWSPEQKVRAKLAMDSRLFDPNYRAAFSYWEEMTSVATEYTRRKSVLFKRRRRQMSAA